MTRSRRALALLRENLAENHPKLADALYETGRLHLEDGGELAGRQLRRRGVDLASWAAVARVAEGERVASGGGGDAAVITSTW